MLDLNLMNRDELISRIDDLEAQIEAMKSSNEPSAILMLQNAFSLTTFEAKFLYVLSDGKPRDKVQLLNGLYFDRAGDPPEIKIIDVFACKVRKKVSRYGIDIETIWGSGYRLQKGLDVIKSAMRGEMPDVVSHARQREHPPHLVKSRSGIAAQKTLAELIKRCDPSGRAEFDAREFAASVSLKRNLSTVITYLEQRGILTVITRASNRGKRSRVWVVKLSPHVRN